MKWLTAVLVLLLLALAALPAAVETVGGWIAHRSASVEPIDYIPGGVHEWSASRRRSPPASSVEPNPNADRR
jgi:hypothetical protein